MRSILLGKDTETGADVRIRYVLIDGETGQLESRRLYKEFADAVRLGLLHRKPPFHAVAVIRDVLSRKLAELLTGSGAGADADLDRDGQFRRSVLAEHLFLAWRDVGHARLGLGSPVSADWIPPIVLLLYG